jgi:hypothetical protein
MEGHMKHIIRVKVVGEDSDVQEFITFVKMGYAVTPDGNPKPNKYGSGLFIFLSVGDKA